MLRVNGKKHMVASPSYHSEGPAVPAAPVQQGGEVAANSRLCLHRTHQGGLEALPKSWSWAALDQAGQSPGQAGDKLQWLSSSPCHRVRACLVSACNFFYRKYSDEFPLALPGTKAAARKIPVWKALWNKRFPVEQKKGYFICLVNLQSLSTS